jgi:hypothetical protein
VHNLITEHSRGVAYGDRSIHDYFVGLLLTFSNRGGDLMTSVHGQSLAQVAAAAPEWRRAMRCSAAGDNCVEVRYLVTGTVSLRDSKAVASGVIGLDEAGWHQFVVRLRRGLLR